MAVLLLINNDSVKYRYDIPKTGSTSESTVGAEKVGVKRGWGDKRSRGGERVVLEHEFIEN
jgi:hypothetical protein